VASAASGRNAGSIQHPLDEARHELYMESVALHRRFGVIAEDGPSGLLVLGDGAVEAAAGFEGLRAEALDGDGLRAIEPELAEGLSGGLIAGTGFPAHPAAATRALAAAARAAGARIEEGVRAVPVVEGGRCTGVELGDGGERVPAGAVLVAAGPWSAPLTGGAVPVSALWGVTVQVALPDDRVVRHRIEDWADPSDAGFEATPLGDVTVLGASRTVDEPDEPSTATTLTTRAARFLPIIADAHIVATRTCARPVTPDGLPLIGPIPGITDLHIASGHGPYGISLGPASGRLAADTILNRATPPPAFAPARFSN
jgi:D-hydroxyproline dehydrogenase subunit beta